MLRERKPIAWIFLSLATVIASTPTFDGQGIPEVVGVAGTTVVLPCNPGDLHTRTIVWIRHNDMHILTVGRFVYTTDARFHIVQESASKWFLKISNVRNSDSGLYDCQTNHAPPKKYPVILTVRDAQQGQAVLMDGKRNVEDGSNITITCLNNDQTSLDVEYSWFHDGTLLGSGDRYIVKGFVKSQKRFSQLTVLKATSADAGEYKCRARGARENSFVITVTGPPPPSQLHVIGVDFGSVKITWNYDDQEGVDASEFDYILEHRPDHSEEDFTEISDIRTNSYNVDGLLPLTEYAFRVSAVRRYGERGNFSEHILVTTGALSFSLLTAVGNGHLSVVKDLLDLEADIDEGDGMYLKMASQRGHLHVVKFLLESGADPDADEDGEAVQEAAKNGHIEVVKALLEAEADANVGDGMHHAVKNNYPEIMKLLDQYGSDVNKPLPERPWKDPQTGLKHGFGWTALHVAARWGQTSLVNLLYNLGSDLGARDPNGDTPLHVAVKYPQIWFVRELLKYCPDLTLQNNDGKTVIDLVEDLPHAIYSSLNTEEGIQLRYLVANITMDKIKTHSNTEDAAAALEDEVEALVESNATISDLVDAVASTDSHVDIVLQELFEDTVYLEIEDAFADHLCTSEESGEWRAALDVQYTAVCICVPGKGPTLELKPLDQSEEIPCDANVHQES